MFKFKEMLIIMFASMYHNKTYDVYFNFNEINIDYCACSYGRISYFDDVDKISDLYINDIQQIV